MTLGIIALVIAFLLGMLSAFPLSKDACLAANSSSESATSQPNDTNAMTAVGERFLLNYQNIVEDIASFQDNPSLERANHRKQALTRFAEDATERYRVFGGELNDILEKLTVQSQAANSH